MRKTSFGLGLAGTILAFVIGFIMLAIGIGTTAVSHVDWDNVSDDFDLSDDFDDFELTIDGEDFNMQMGRDFDFTPRTAFGMLGSWLLISSICLIISGILGIIGIVITKKRKSTAAGILLLLAGLLSIISLWGLHATVLLIPAGILAFLKDKNENVQIEA